MDFNSSQSSLVLLPPVPQPATYPAVKAAFHTPLLLALRATHESTLGRAVLDIALPCPHLQNTSATRCALYAQTQEIVANVYKLVCVIATRQGIEVADVDGDTIDVRVILVSYPRHGLLHTNTSAHSSFGPVVELQTLANSEREWKQVFSVETEQGEQLLKNFKTLTSTKRSSRYETLRGGVVQIDHSRTIPVSSTELNLCNSVAVGGTFDHLHIGHKLLLTMTAFSVDPPHGEEQHLKTKVITIGVTAADLLAKKKYAELLQPWRTRVNRAHAFLRGILFFSLDAPNTEQVEEINKPGPNGNALIVRVPYENASLQIRYVEIWDPFGPTITDAGIDTLVVSGETRSGGTMVNDKRREMNMDDLTILEVDVLSAHEEGDAVSNAESIEDAFKAKLSSTEIRKIQAVKANGRSKV